MSVTVRIPTALRQFTDGQAEVPVPIDQEKATVGEVLNALARTCPGVVDRVLDETGVVRRHVNVFVGTANVRDGSGLGTVLADGAEVTILPAVSGG